MSDALVCLGSTVVGHNKVAEVLALAARGKAEYLEKVSSITDEELRNLLGAYGRTFPSCEHTVF